MDSRIILVIREGRGTPNMAEVALDEVERLRQLFNQVRHSGDQHIMREICDEALNYEWPNSDQSVMDLS